jgi:hypothetical protein
VPAGEPTIRRAHNSRPASVYISYAADDPRSHTVAEYVRAAMLERYGVPCAMLAPDDGALTFLDYEEALKARAALESLQPALYLALPCRPAELAIDTAESCSGLSSVESRCISALPCTLSGIMLRAACKAVSSFHASSATNVHVCRSERTSSRA